MITSPCVYGRVIKTTGTATAAAAAQANHRPAAETNFTLPLMTKLFLVSEKFGIARRAMGDVLPSSSGCSSVRAATLRTTSSTGAAAAFRVRIVPEYRLLNGTTDLLKLLLPAFLHPLSINAEV